MYLTKEKKQEIFGEYGKSNTDTGSAESQIALFSYRISRLTDHLKLNKKDKSTSYAMKKLVGQRRSLLDYLKKRDINRYRAIIEKLGLRK
ncbi:MAG: 30S ribosomal protein S15 [Bacteroidales bacterium]|nr:30S ribosomal protein S15 [Bacteroidales bacterium]